MNLRLVSFYGDQHLLTYAGHFDQQLLGRNSDTAWRHKLVSMFRAGHDDLTMAILKIWFTPLLSCYICDLLRSMGAKFGI